MRKMALIVALIVAAGFAGQVLAKQTGTFRMSDVTARVKLNNSKSPKPDSKARRWVFDNVIGGTTWDEKLFTKHLGDYEKIEVIGRQSHEGYYFSKPDMSIAVNSLKGTVSFWRIGRGCNATKQSKRSAANPQTNAKATTQIQSKNNPITGKTARKWVFDNVNIGTKWNAQEFVKHLDSYKEVEITNRLSHKGYYFQKASVLIAVNTFTDKVSFWCFGCIDEPIFKVKQTQQPNKIPEYDLAGSKNISTDRVKKVEVRIRVAKEPSETEIKSICEDIFVKLEKLEICDAVVILFYLSDSNIEGHFTAGKAVWAPFGDLTKAANPRYRQKSNYRFSIQTGNALGKLPEKNETAASMPEKKKRKQIYHELLEESDKTGSDIEADKIIAKRHNISSDDIHKISLEGVLKGWQ